MEKLTVVTTREWTIDHNAMNFGINHYDPFQQYIPCWDKDTGFDLDCMYPGRKA